MGVITWEIDREIARSPAQQVLSSCPTGKNFFAVLTTSLQISSFISCVSPKAHHTRITGVPATTPSATLDFEGQPSYIIKTMLNSQFIEGKLEYLIEWEGYSPMERCWILAHDILNPLLTQEFHAKHPECPGRLPRDRAQKNSTPVVSCSRGGSVISVLESALNSISQNNLQPTNIADYDSSLTLSVMFTVTRLRIMHIWFQ